MIKWAAGLEIFFTRSRPYKKNDQATIESKNNHLVRKYGFYYRYDTTDERAVLNRLWRLVTVAEVGSVTKAARLLHLVQPAVTRQISLLEEEIGVPLFDRTRQGMTPTVAGAALVERARAA